LSTETPDHFHRFPNIPLVTKEREYLDQGKSLEKRSSTEAVFKGIIHESAPQHTQQLLPKQMKVFAKINDSVKVRRVQNQELMISAPEEARSHHRNKGPVVTAP